MNYLLFLSVLPSLWLYVHSGDWESEGKRFLTKRYISLPASADREALVLII